MFIVKCCKGLLETSVFSFLFVCSLAWSLMEHASSCQPGRSPTMINMIYLKTNHISLTCALYSALPHGLSLKTLGRRTSEHILKVENECSRDPQLNQKKTVSLGPALLCHAWSPGEFVKAVWYSALQVTSTTHQKPNPVSE